MFLLSHLCRHSDWSLGTLLHLGNFNWPHLEILFTWKRSQILKKDRKQFLKEKENKKKRERMKGRAKERVKRYWKRGRRRKKKGMIVIFLRECVWLLDSPGLLNDKELSQVLSEKLRWIFNKIIITRGQRGLNIWPC